MVANTKTKRPGREAAGSPLTEFADLFLQKPFALEQFFEAVRELSRCDGRLRGSG